MGYDGGDAGNGDDTGKTHADTHRQLYRRRLTHGSRDGNSSGGFRHLTHHAKIQHNFAKKTCFQQMQESRGSF